MRRIGYLGIFAVLFFILTLINPSISEAKINSNLSNILDVKYEGLANFIEIKLTKEVYPQFVNLENPLRMVIDFPDTYYLNASKTINVDDSYIKKIRVGQFQKEPPIARVTIEMKKDFKFDITTSTDNEQQTIRLATESEQINTTINNDYLLKRKVQNTIKSVEFDDSLRIAGDDFISYTLSKSTTPNTYTIKFKNFTTNGIDEFPIKSDEIKKIRVTELNNDSIFTFELKQGLKLSAKLLPSQKVLQINTMVSNDPIITPPVKLPSITPPPVTKIASLANSNFAIPTVQDELSLKFDNSPNDKMDKIYLSSDKRAINYQISTRINPNRIVIDTFGAKISGIANLENINSSFIKKIRSGTNEEGQNDASSRIVLELKKDVLFRETLLSENKVLEIDIGERKKFYVTIDPGHGGRDPGAVGPQKTNEKDVTLAVAYSLRKKLLDDNIGVLLARKDDSEVFLKPRVDLANLSGSDIFVSIHCNAMVSPVSSGIETYYKTSQSSKLAQILHNTIISKLPTLDRGIRTQSFYVIKYTTMPSVLIEIGFITNPNEEALLASAEYQEKVAAAIYDGIKQYMMEKSRI